MRQTNHGKPRVWLIQKGVWDMPKESMPLAIGYLKATALANETIRENMQVDIFNFDGGDGQITMANELFSQDAPDVMAFSVLGWNYRMFGALAETFKQLNPAGWVIFGGNHVANQAERVMRDFPMVDIVVNCEGEFIFRDLLLEYLHGRSRHALSSIGGISYVDEAGKLATTPEPPRISDLSEVPSPILSGAIPLTDAAGDFRYDVALMETNRGCPYSCAFCYWGGATGQKMRTFPRDRLKEELEMLAFHKVPSVALCDSNFGLLKTDLEFVEDLIHTREKYGYPRSLITSWAKNKSTTFYSIVKTLKENDMHSSFTLALQTLNDNALTLMKRKNMRVNEWEGLVEWLDEQGLECYAEMIWGAPGETFTLFLEGYDRLAKYVPRIATYPLILIPNTSYFANRNEHGFVTVRGEYDDFEYVIANKDISMEENRRMQQFLLWARGIPEHHVLRYIWAPLRELTDITQSQVLLSMSAWFKDCEDPVAEGLNLRQELLLRPSMVPAFLHHLYSEPQLDLLFSQWWKEEMDMRMPAPIRAFMSDVFRYDWMTKPIYDPEGTDVTATGKLERVTEGQEVYYVRRGQQFDYDVPTLVAAIKQRAAYTIEVKPVTLDIWYKAGFGTYIDNHETAGLFLGQPRYISEPDTDNLPMQRDVVDAVG
jgi:radical SAM C-methyltransferase